MNQEFEIYVCDTPHEYQKKVADIQARGDKVSMVQFQSEVWVITALIMPKEQRPRRPSDDEIRAAFDGKPS